MCTHIDSGAAIDAGLQWSSDHVGAAEQLRRELEEERAATERLRRELESARRPSSPPAMAPPSDGGAPPTRLYPEPPSQPRREPTWWVVIGGAMEGVHGVYEPEASAAPLPAWTTTPGTRVYGPADGVTDHRVAQLMLDEHRREREARQWRASEQADVPQGMPEVLTYPQARQAIAALGPESPIREIKRVCEAGGLPVSTAVGGNARALGYLAR